MLHLDASQVEQIQKQYSADTHFHQLYPEDHDSQDNAIILLRSQGLDLQNMDDLGNGWSKRCSTLGGTVAKRHARVLLQW